VKDWIKMVKIGVVYCWEQMVQTVLSKRHQHNEGIVSEFHVITYCVDLSQTEITISSVKIRQEQSL
jgi:hypothetical protein